MYHYYFIFFILTSLLCFTISHQYNDRYSKFIRNPYNQITSTETRNISQEFYNNYRPKVSVKVYYETLCPASVDFFTTQLKPVIEKLRTHVDVHLVPYGHAKTLKLYKHFVFRCQHGPQECYGNKLHACATDVIQNKTQAVIFNACLMQYSAYNPYIDGYNFAIALNWCGYKLDVLINGIWECVNSERANVLLNGFGEETQAVRPEYVPYVILNNSTSYQDQALDNLMGTLCNMLNPVPRACT